MTSPERAHREADNGPDPEGGPPKSGARPRAALAALGLLLLIGLMLAALPHRKVDRFERWRSEQLERGVQVQTTPAEIELAWVRLGLGGVVGLGLLGALVVLGRRLAASRESDAPHAPTEQPALEAALESIRSSLVEVQGEVVRTREELAELQAKPAPPQQAAAVAPVRTCPVSTPLTTLVEELQSSSVPQRLAALHSLGRLAEWDPEWVPTVAQVLAAYLKQHAPAGDPGEETRRRTLLGGSRLREPVVLGALPKEGLERPLDLRALDLRELCLKGAHLEGALLRGTLLAGVSLAGSHLEGADLSGSRGLTPGQLAEAHTDGGTRLPAALEQAN